MSYAAWNIVLEVQLCQVVSHVNPPCLGPRHVRVLFPHSHVPLLPRYRCCRWCILQSQDPRYPWHGMTQTAWTSQRTIMIKDNLLACNQVAGGGDAKANGAACFDRNIFGRCSEGSICCFAASDQAPERPTGSSRRPRCTLQIIAATCFLRTGHRDSWMGNLPSKTLFTKACSGGTGRATDPPRPPAFQHHYSLISFHGDATSTQHWNCHDFKLECRARRSSKIEASVKGVTQGCCTCLHDISGDVLIQAWQDPDLRISSLKRVQTWKSQVWHS